MAIRVLIVDDHRLFRQGLCKLLEEEPDIEVVGEAEDGLAAREAVRELNPDVVLMDVKMPKVDGVAATRMILEDRPETGVIILTMFDGDTHAAQAIQAGARGYILKTSDSDEVAAAIRAVYKGASLIDPTITTKVLNEFRRMSSHRGRAEKGPGALTEKEIAMLRLLARGLSNKAIAKELSYAESTVKNRLSVIFEKICVEDRTQAVVYAINHGLCSILDDVTV